jgi:hypothetical protein
MLPMEATVQVVKNLNKMTDKEEQAFKADIKKKTETVMSIILNKNNEKNIVTFEEYKDPVLEKEKIDKN